MVETHHSLRVIDSGFEDLRLPSNIPVTRLPTHRPVVRRLADRLLSKSRRNTRGARDTAAELNSLDLHFLWFLTPTTFQTTLPYAVTVWDLAHRLEPAFPEVRTAGWRWDQREAHYSRSLPSAAYVITGAAAARDTIVRCYGVSPARVRVFPLVAPTLTADTAIDGPPVAPPYLFYPAQFWPHKNHVGLLLALQVLREQHNIEMRLVLTGSDKGNLDHVKATARELGLYEQVTFLGFVPSRQLVSLYRHASALIFPSFFGPDNLPPLEAMQLRCPVIAANVPGSAEQLGEAALLVDPRDPATIAAAITRLQTDPELRQHLIQRGIERVERWGPRDYVQAMLRTVDEFEAERRCWSYSSEYLHP
jgi:glycosyltransferase involved in cell wall biosynthesis